MLYSFRKFLQHYASATLIDVLHSPFVFRLYQTCIARQHSPKELEGIYTLWKNIVANKTTIKQNDLGTGKTENKSSQKTISYFAKNYAKPKRIAQIIYRIVQKYNYTNCIELGTSLGFSSMHIAKALNKNASFTTIEGCNETAQLAQSHFNQLNLPANIKLEVGDFNDVLPELLKTYNKVDFAFIDGNHTYEATMHYFNLLLKKKHENTLFIFDDIYWSKGMTKAWNEIKSHEDVTVTVDLFFIGLVYFKIDQRKQHFKLRVF